MSYTLDAIIGLQSVLQKETASSLHAPLILLSQEFAMVPLTDELYEEIQGRIKDPKDPEEEEGWEKPSEEIALWVRKMSLHSKIAYIQIECWGGNCTHASTVFENGQIILGPLKTLSGHHDSLELSQTAANIALRKLGVQVTTLDEFWSLGLQQHRYSEEWASTKK